MTGYFICALIILGALAGAMLSAMNLCGIAGVSWWWVAACFAPLAVLVVAFIAGLLGMMDDWH